MVERPGLLARPMVHKSQDENEEGENISLNRKGEEKKIGERGGQEKPR